MNRILGKYSGEAYALMRMVAGFLFACHGSQKLLGFPGNPEHTVPIFSLIGLAGLIELVAGVLIAIGLGVGWAAFLASGEMAAAYFMAHAPKSFWPIANGGELAALYCFVFLYLATQGDGKWSVARVLSRRAP